MQHNTQDHKGSEVERLLAHIQAEYESGVRGLSGFASGSARHTFITARMERIGHWHHELQELVGEQEAIACLVQALEQSSDQSSQIQQTEPLERME